MKKATVAKTNRALFAKMLAALCMLNSVGAATIPPPPSTFPYGRVECGKPGLCSETAGPRDPNELHEVRACDRRCPTHASPHLRVSRPAPETPSRRRLRATESSLWSDPPRFSRPPLLYILRQKTTCSASITSRFVMLTRPYSRFRGQVSPSPPCQDQLPSCEQLKTFLPCSQIQHFCAVSCGVCTPLSPSAPPSPSPPPPSPSRPPPRPSPPPPGPSPPPPSPSPSRSPPLPPPPPPPSQPPYVFTNTDALEEAVQAFTDDFANALSKYGPIENWEVSRITNMSGLFAGNAGFNRDVSSWNTSGVTDMSHMFAVRSDAAPPSHHSGSHSAPDPAPALLDPRRMPSHFQSCPAPRILRMATVWLGTGRGKV